MVVVSGTGLLTEGEAGFEWGGGEFGEGVGTERTPRELMLPLVVGGAWVEVEEECEGGGPMTSEPEEVMKVRPEGEEARSGSEGSRSETALPDGRWPCPLNALAGDLARAEASISSSESEPMPRSSTSASSALPPWCACAGSSSMAKGAAEAEAEEEAAVAAATLCAEGSTYPSGGAKSTSRLASMMEMAPCDAGLHSNTSRK